MHFSVGLSLLLSDLAVELPFLFNVKPGWLGTPNILKK
jgi:hypothetical protein